MNKQFVNLLIKFKFLHSQGASVKNITLIKALLFIEKYFSFRLD